MKNFILLVSTFIGFLFALESNLLPGEIPKETQNLAIEIEGTWTEICKAGDGHIMLMLPTFAQYNNWFFDDTYFIWKVSKEKIEKGPDSWRFPSSRIAYKLNPDNMGGAIDLMPLSKDGKPWEDDKGNKIIWKGIYLLKDDYLMICYTIDLKAKRPEKFNKLTGVTILRRGIQKRPIKEFP